MQKLNQQKNNGPTAFIPSCLDCGSNTVVPQIWPPSPSNGGKVSLRKRGMCKMLENKGDNALDHSFNPLYFTDRFPKITKPLSEYQISRLNLCDTTQRKQSLKGQIKLPSNMSEQKPMNSKAMKRKQIQFDSSKELVNFPRETMGRRSQEVQLSKYLSPSLPRRDSQQMKPTTLSFRSLN